MTAHARDLLRQSEKWRELIKLVDMGLIAEPDSLSGVDHWRLMAEQLESLAARPARRRKRS